MLGWSLFLTETLIGIAQRKAAQRWRDTVGIPHGLAVAPCARPSPRPGILQRLLPMSLCEGCLQREPLRARPARIFNWERLSSALRRYTRFEQRRRSQTDTFRRHSPGRCDFLPDFESLLGRRCPLLPLRTPKEKLNLSDHQEEIPKWSIPRTFSNVILLAQALGIGFLWIDSLRIVQGDAPSDWEAEASKMPTIYRGAVLVISATSSKSPNNGARSVRRNSASTQFLHYRGRGAKTHLISPPSGALEPDPGVPEPADPHPRLDLPGGDVSTVASRWEGSH